MLGKLIKKIFGSRNDRLIKKMMLTVDKINALEEGIAALSDEALKGKTDDFRSRLESGEELDILLPEVFAVVREASKRVLDMRHFDVQLIGGMALHQGKIAEMKTGEGKTLVATLAVYLNALPGHGVHVVTVNDYLASRDAEWMGRLYDFLGLKTGVIVAGQDATEKQAAYACDIVYGTNNEFGFDYLRDNMAFRLEDKMQRDLHFAVVDEVDSILIDEARTPLVISGPADDAGDLYTQVNQLVPALTRQEKREEKAEGEDEYGAGDYNVDEEHKQIHLSEDGHQHVEDLLMDEGLLGEGESLYDATNLGLMHHVMASLRAHVLFHKDVDYIVQDQQIVIVDEFTGRTMPGRRWSEGLHQALEAKEGLQIQSENQTLASITFQNYFRLYKKLSGMTGTADTEAYEFQQIYGLEVLVIPTHQGMNRTDHGDLVYLTTEEKFQAIKDDVKDCQQRGQPVLVGTASIETSELLSGLLQKDGVKHEVLNAKQHEREAHIVAQAGAPGAITIATNMAGRGTDIVLGGSLDEELKGAGEISAEQESAIRDAWQQRHNLVLEKGGLHIIGTERHESRRVDNQLRGRSGRQGDVGSSRFYLSLNDNLMRIFASDRMSGLMQKLGMEEGEAIEHPWVTKAIENAQRKVEAQNFGIRKSLLEFDDVANDQRRVVYTRRNELMAADDVSDVVDVMRTDVLTHLINNFIPPGSLDEMWDVAGLEQAIEQDFAQPMPIQQWLDEDDNLHEETLRNKILDEVVNAYKDKETQAGSDVVRHFEKSVMLQVLDGSWKEHLAAMDYLRQGIHLRSYAQKNPKQEYKKESFEMFTDLLERIKHEVVGIISKVQVRAEEDVQAMEQRRTKQTPMSFRHADFNNPETTKIHDPDAEDAEDTGDHSPFVRQNKKVGRNHPCPCGSGKKYKQCHGKLS
ncbi:MAG: preprotein translocase subunit SecA [Gammaproteobacteria bacterium]|nr:preprotein translocase subunit SecA [Gammaproteobacteria bacterium]